MTPKVKLPLVTLTSQMGSASHLAPLLLVQLSLVPWEGQWGMAGCLDPRHVTGAMDEVHGSCLAWPWPL